MEIKILGSSCASCKALYQTTTQAVDELGLSATVTYEEDLEAILDYQVVSVPALIINEKVVSTGKHLSLIEVKYLLTLSVSPAIHGKARPYQSAK